MEPDSRTPGSLALDPTLARRIRLGLIALAVVAVAVLAWFIVKALREEKANARWDELAQLQERFEPTPIEDPLWEDPAGVYADRRERYVAALEAFLPRAEQEDDALAQHVHFLIASLAADQWHTLRDPLATEERQAWYDRARKHWEILRDRYPDFQGNWLAFAPPGHASVVRKVLAVLESNQSWITEHTLVVKDPPTDVVAVIRTERGDLRLGLYREDAPELVQAFLDRATRGAYDGTAFDAKTDLGSDADPTRRTIRGGSPATRDLPPHDAVAAKALAEPEPALQRVVPAPSRYRIAAAEGVVTAWHDDADPYDGGASFLVCVGRSPQMDRAFSPFGRLLDAPSRATATRILQEPTWGDRSTGEPPADLPVIRDFLRAPVKIVKVLVFRDGALVEPEGGSAPTRGAPTDAERRLDALVVDAYRVEPPSEPLAPPRAPSQEPGPSTPPPPESPAPPGGEMPGDETPDR